MLYKIYIYVLIGNFLGALAPPLSKIAMNLSSVSFVMFFRYLITSLVILLFYRHNLHFKDFFNQIKVNKKFKVIVILSAIIPILFNYIFNKVLSFESVVVVMFIVTVSNMVISFLFSTLFYKEKISIKMTFYIFLSIIGLYFLITNGESFSEFKSISLLSFLLLLFSSLLSSIENFLNTEYMKEGGENNMILLIKTIFISFSMLFLIVVNLDINIKFLFSGGITLLLLLLYLGTSTYIRNIFLLKSIEYIGPDRTVIFGNVNVIFVALIGFLFLNESFSFYKIVGILFIIISLFLISIFDKNNKKFIEKKIKKGDLLYEKI